MVTDKEMNSEPLPFANIFIKGTSIGGTSDMDGKYSIPVPAGNHVLVFSFIGYETIEKPITVVAGKTLTINQELGASQGVALDEVEIKGTTSKEKSSALLLEQKKATVIKESIGAEELSQKGVSDAASAVSKISGVSKQEGSSNVYVRGLGDRYLNTTMNGLSLPSNDIAKKNIDLGLFPSDIIQNVSISKAYSSSFYGDFAAGNIDISSKEYNGNGFFDLNIGTGVNSRAAGENFKKSEGTGQFGFYNRYQHNPFAVVLSHGIDPVDAGNPINGSIGFNAGKSFEFKNGSRLSLFGTASFDRSFQYREGPLVDYTNVFKKVFPNSKEYEYSTTTTGMLSATYRINSDHKLKYTSLFLNNSSDQTGYYGYKGLGQNRDALINTDQGFYQMNVQFNQDLVFVNQITGEHKFYNDEEREDLELTWGIGYNNVYAHEPDRRRISIENYHLALDNNTATNPVFFINNSFDNQRYFQKIIDEELNSRVNLAYKPTEKLTFNFGYNGRTKQRNFENIRYGYEVLDRNATPITDVNNLDALFDINNIQFFQNQSGKLFRLDVFNQIPGYNGDNIVSLPGVNENEYIGDLSIHAGYVSSEIKASDRLTLIPGIRLESFTQEVNIDPSDPGARKVTETFFLPNLNVKYSLTEDQNLRFNFSKTVSVPEFKEVAPFIYEGIGQRIAGNPNLLDDPSFSEIYNADIKYEWFLSRDELLSFATFFKQINDPINLVAESSAAGNQRYFRTSESAEVFGLEIETRKNIIKNEDEETQLSAGFNFTYMYTNQDLIQTIQGGSSQFTTSFNRSSDKLQGASDILLNANINYSPTQFDNYKPIASLVFSYYSDRISALGAGTLGNIIEKGVPTLDFVWKNKFGENWELNLSAKNLLDPSITRVREDKALGDIVISDFKIGSTISLGLKYKL